MNLTKEKWVILSLTLAFIAMSLLYFQSLITIEKIYSSSVITSLESDFNRISFINTINESSTTTASENLDATTTPVVLEEEILPPKDTACYRGGCSGQLCGDASIQDIATTCEWREEYACYAEPVGICERQSDGQCGWTPTEELNSCLIKASSVNTETPAEATIDIEVI